MAFKEKSAWIMLVISAGAYFFYLSTILSRAGTVPLTEVSYIGTLAWTIGLVILGSIWLHMMVAMHNPKEANQEDQRDREIHQHGEYIGQWVVVAGAMAAMIMSLIEFDHFWIANTIYLAFVVSAVLGSAIKIVAYRRGF